MSDPSVSRRDDLHTYEDRSLWDDLSHERGISPEDDLSVYEEGSVSPSVRRRRTDGSFSGIRYSVYRIKYSVFGITYSVYRIKYSVFGITYLVYRYTVFGIAYTVYGIPA